MQKFKIRKAKINDSNSIISLIMELAKYEREEDAVNLSEDDIKNDGFGPNPKFECLVAELNEEIVGLALFYPRYSTWEGQTLHLEDLIVTKNQRNKGIGKALYLSFIREAINYGVNRVEWAVLEWNIPAIKFYEESGAKIFPDWRTFQMTRQQMKNLINDN